MQVRVGVKESNFLVETNNQFEDFDTSVQVTSSSSSSLRNDCGKLKRGIFMGIIQIAIISCASYAG